MRYAFSVKDMSFQDQVRLIGNEVGRYVQSIDESVALIGALDFLDIKILNVPVTKGIMQRLLKLYGDNKELVSSIVLSLSISDEYKRLLLNTDI